MLPPLLVKSGCTFDEFLDRGLGQPLAAAARVTALGRLEPFNRARSGACGGWIPVLQRRGSSRPISATAACWVIFISKGATGCLSGAVERKLTAILAADDPAGEACGPAVAEHDHEFFKVADVPG